MKAARTTALLLIFVAAQTGTILATDIPVAPDSDMGKLILSMDRKARATQNERMFTRALQDFETVNQKEYSDLRFYSLEEPPVSVQGHSATYIMNGGRPKETFYRKFKVTITFKDQAMTLATSIKVLEALDPVKR